MKKEANERQKKIIKNLAEMRVLSTLNISGKIGSINSKEFKASVIQEIQAIENKHSSQAEEKHEANVINFVRTEMEFVRNSLLNIEEKISRIEKRRHKKNKK